MKVISFKKVFRMILPAVVGISIMLSGCAKKDDSAAASSAPSAAPTSAEPITLTFYNDINLPASDVDALIVQPAKKKFPAITLTIVNPGKGTQLSDLVAAGQYPDIIFGGFYNQSRNDDLGVIANLDDLIKKAKIDMSKYPSALTDTFKLYNPHWYALPLYVNIAALWYNKDIFDKFAVPYPKDNLTWKDAIELGKKLTRKDGSVNYMGFYPGNWSFLAGQLAIPRIDPKTYKAEFNTPDMKMVFQTLKDGNEAAGSANVDYGKAKTMFLNDKSIAMFPYWMIVGELEDIYNKQGNSLNWDMAQI